MSKFRSFYPFDFQLFNENGEHAFFIEDQTEKVTLSITNKGTLPINFRILEGQHPDSGYHFLLRFRPGTLSSPEKITLESEHWGIKISKVQGMDVIAFTLKEVASEAALIMEPDDVLELPMSNFLADRRTGARETSVELLCDHIFNTESSQIIKANRLVKWPIINHRGNATLPVHVGCVGSDTILNNGEANELTLRISLLHHKDNLKLIYSTDESEKSKIILSFDEGAQEDEWTIADITTSHSFKLSTDSPYLTASKDEEGLPTLFTVSCSEKDVVMGRHVTNEPMDVHHIPNHFDIKIRNIITKHPSGKTNCYVRFENIPGYWDNSFIVTIEKQPMIFRGQQVGIGKLPNSTAALDIVGGLIVDGKVELKKDLDVKENVIIEGTVEVKKKITALGDLSVNENLAVGKNAEIGGNLKTKGRVSDKTGDVMPVGSVIAYAGTNPPPGWLPCNGLWYHDKDHLELYKALGSPQLKDIKWNDGVIRSAFQLPDLRSRFIVGAGQGFYEKKVQVFSLKFWEQPEYKIERVYFSDYPINLIGGEEQHKLTIEEMPAHTHSYNKLGFQESKGTGHYSANKSEIPTQTLPTGGDQPHNNLPPYYALTYIIKY
jgi:microcystin-dependent protein